MIWLSVLSMMVAQAPAQGDCVLEGVVSLKNPNVRTAVSDTVIYLKDGPPRARPEPETHIMTQRDLQFWPRTLVVMLNDRVSFVNEDGKTEHSVFSRLGKDPFLGDLNTRATTYSRIFAKEGPVHIQCNRHEKMWADILVLRSPAFARPDAKGNWTISGLERKNYTLVAWEPNGGEETREVICGGKKIDVELEGKSPPKALRRDGSRYRPEYQDPW
jgi:plastocyanin